MVKRILMYGFPFFLILIESILRGTYSLKSQPFIGPTIAGAGVAFLLPLIVPKKKDFHISENIKRKLKEKGITIISRRDKVLIEVVWLFIFLCTALWAYSVLLSCRSPQINWWLWPSSLYPAIFCYLSGVLLYEIKEVA